MGKRDYYSLSEDRDQYSQHCQKKQRTDINVPKFQHESNNQRSDGTRGERSSYHSDRSQQEPKFSNTGTYQSSPNYQKTHRDSKLRTARSVPEFQQKGRTTNQASKFVPGTSWTPIPDQLPVLPAIKDKKLEDLVFTHSSHISGTEINTGHNCYERLEFLGDAYIQLISTRLVNQHFTTVPVGKLSYYRQALIRNTTLAAYADAYNFFPRVQHTIPEPTGAKLEKMKADVFEAYVAAIVQDDPENGLKRVEEWVGALWEPYVVQQGTEIETTTKPMENPKDLLHRKMACRGEKIEFRQTKHELNRAKGLYFFEYACHHMGARDTYLASGVGNSKAQACDRAAAEALATKGELLDHIIASRDPVYKP